ncbi:MAG: isoprenylcysteine carboxylmethyltransferase family protein [Cellvibrionaceae bacterium]
MAPDKLVIVLLGTTINLLIISTPRLLAPGEWANTFADPLLLAWYLLISASCLAESLACPAEPMQRADQTRNPVLPYITGLALLGLIWAIQLNDIVASNATVLSFGVGAVLSCLGIGLRVTAILSLGPLFISHISLVPGHRLVTQGLYAWLRHPSELGLLLFCFGLSIAMRSPVGLALTVAVMIPLSFSRIRAENTLLAAQFPALYRAYKESTPALLPRIPKFVRGHNKYHNKQGTV